MGNLLFIFKQINADVRCRCCKASCDVPSGSYSSANCASSSCSLAVVGLRRNITTRLARLRSRRTRTPRASSVNTASHVRRLTVYMRPIHILYTLFSFLRFIAFLTFLHNTPFLIARMQPINVCSTICSICRLPFQRISVAVLMLHLFTATLQFYPDQKFKFLY